MTAWPRETSADVWCTPGRDMRFIHIPAFSGIFHDSVKMSNFSWGITIANGSSRDLPSAWLMNFLHSDSQNFCFTSYCESVKPKFPMVWMYRLWLLEKNCVRRTSKYLLWLFSKFCGSGIHLQNVDDLVCMCLSVRNGGHTGQALLSDYSMLSVPGVNGELRDIFIRSLVGCDLKATVHSMLFHCSSLRSPRNCGRSRKNWPGLTRIELILLRRGRMSALQINFRWIQEIKPWARTWFSVEVLRAPERRKRSRDAHDFCLPLYRKWGSHQRKQKRKSAHANLSPWTTDSLLPCFPSPNVGKSFHELSIYASAFSSINTNAGYATMHASSGRSSYFRLVSASSVLFFLQ